VEIKSTGLTMNPDVGIKRAILKHWPVAETRAARGRESGFGGREKPKQYWDRPRWGGRIQKNGTGNGGKNMLNSGGGLEMRVGWQERTPPMREQPRGKKHWKLTWGNGQPYKRQIAKTSELKLVEGGERGWQGSKSFFHSGKRQNFWSLLSQT